MEKEDFLIKAKEKYGDRYDYSLVNFSNTNDKIAIICPEHGVFYKSIVKHLYTGQGCPECSGKKRYTTEDFIKKIQNLPNIDNLSFENVNYINNKTKIKVFCHEKDENGNEHGEFEITPTHFLSGERCPKCRYLKSSESKRRSIDEVINEARKIHGDKYDYSAISKYKNDRTKYPIICPEHGVFYQTFNNHIKGKQGCPVCGRMKGDEGRRIPFEEWEEKCNLVHNGYYVYHPESYTGIMGKTRITCPKHGDFYQLASNHLHLGEGCPSCACVKSQGENDIYRFLIDLLGEDNVFSREKSILANRHEIDIYLPSHKIGIEYDGLYWHSELMKDKNYHLNKTIECNNNGIRLFHIYEDEWRNKQDIIKSMLKNLLGKTENKIYARKCIIKEVSTKNANQFLDNNHLQGKCPSKVKLGLYYNNELVSLMTFGKCRHFVGNGNHQWELLRFANKINVNIIGGASKLFNYFIKKYNPEDIVSYADRRWSMGNLYNILGFTKYNESKPNYYYIINNKRIYRFNLRKSVLIKKYGCPKTMTEREFCFKQKWYRIYDCGCLCYVWKKEK